MKMSNLRMLKFYEPKNFNVSDMSSKVHLAQGIEYLPKELTYLHWHGYPLKMLPSNFDPANFVELNLPYSKSEQLWEGEKAQQIISTYILLLNSQFNGANLL